MGKMFNKVAKAINKTDVLEKLKLKIDKAAQGKVLTKELEKELNGIRAEYLTNVDQIAREQSKVNLEFDVKYHNEAEKMMELELEWWKNLKKVEVVDEK
jgi:hypothetical protein